MFPHIICRAQTSGIDCTSLSIRIEHRRRKVLNIWGGGGGGGGVRGKVQNIEGPMGGAKLFAGCKLIGAPAPKSVPNNYMSHTESR